MLVRVAQFIRFFNPDIDEKTEAEALKVLNEKEREIYMSMALYDRSHSLAVYHDIDKIEMSPKEKRVLLKCALLHDCGKGDKVNLWERVWYAVTKQNKILKTHAESGYLILKKIGSSAADLVRNHHNAKSTDPLIKIFREIDDRN